MQEGKQSPNNITFTDQENLNEVVTNDVNSVENEENEQNKTSYFGFKFNNMDPKEPNPAIVAKRDSFFASSRPQSKAKIVN